MSLVNEKQVLEFGKNGELCGAELVAIATLEHFSRSGLIHDPLSGQMGM